MTRIRAAKHVQSTAGTLLHWLLLLAEETLSSLIKISCRIALPIALRFESLVEMEMEEGY